MTHFKSPTNIRKFTLAAAIAALALGACASTPDKTEMVEAPSVTKTETITPEVVSENSATAKPGMVDTSSTLILKVSGYEARTGQIMVAVYNTEEGFDSEGAPFREAKSAVDSAQTLITFGNLPAGDYAFKVFHDVNGNGKLDTNAFGMPTEKYAFSLDASDPFSAPEWVESYFSLEKGEDVRNVSFD